MSKRERIKTLVTGDSVLWITCPICGKLESGVREGEVKKTKCYDCMGKDREFEISRFNGTIKITLYIDELMVK